MNANFLQYPDPSRRMVTLGARGMVAASQQLAAQAGLEMLKKGGNAIDAAIATAACLTVVEPTSNGLGGDAFALVWTDGKLYGLNSSGAAPMALDPQALREAGGMPMRGLAPITVPGVPAAWAELSQKFGRLSMMQALRPAVEYAEEGFPVSPTISELWRKAANETFAPLRGQPEYDEWFRVFTDDGRPPEP
ncbi:MAG: gamma-glutamyltransferase, partial [Oscillospiraceae bacterium]